MLLPVDDLYRASGIRKALFVMTLCPKNMNRVKIFGQELRRLCGYPTINTSKLIALPMI